MKLMDMSGIITKGIIVIDEDGNLINVADSFEALTRSMHIWHIVNDVIFAGNKFCDYFYDMNTGRVALVMNDEDTDGKWRDARPEEVKWFKALLADYLKTKEER